MAGNLRGANFMKSSRINFCGFNFRDYHPNSGAHMHSLGIVHAPSDRPCAIRSSAVSMLAMSDVYCLASHDRFCIDSIKLIVVQLLEVHWHCCTGQLVHSPRMWRRDMNLKFNSGQRQQATSARVFRAIVLDRGPLQSSTPSPGWLR